MPDIPKPTCDHCDRAVDLLRQVQRWLKRGGTSSVAGRIDSFLAEQQCVGEDSTETPTSQPKY